RVGFERRDLALEHRAASRVLVAQIDIDIRDADCPRRDQHAFEEAMRVALQVIAILERARLAFVDVHGHQPRGGLGTYDLPFPAGGKPGDAQATQAAFSRRRDACADGALAADAGAYRAIAAFGAIRAEADI